MRSDGWKLPDIILASGAMPEGSQIQFVCQPILLYEETTNRTARELFHHDCHRSLVVRVDPRSAVSIYRGRFL